MKLKMDSNMKIQRKKTKIWKRRLDLKKKKYPNIEIIRIENKGAFFNLIFNGNSPHLKWNYNEKHWEIHLLENAKEGSIAHELGHLYFAKEVENPRFTPKFEILGKRFKTNQKIIRILNVLIDNFVDNHLFPIKNYYNLWLDKIKEALKIGFVLDKKINSKNFYADLIGSRRETSTNRLIFITTFLLVYLQFELLKKEDKNELLTNIEIYLKQIEYNLLEIPNFSEENLNQLKRELNQFNKIKSTKNSEEIVVFLHQITTIISNVEDINLTKEIIDEQFKLIFDYSIDK